MTDEKTALVTNAIGFAGPPAVAALLDAGFRVAAHDRTFADDGAWEQFAAGRSGLTRIADAEPEGIVAAALAASGRLEVIVSNDHFPAKAQRPEAAPIEDLHGNLEALVAFPFRLVQAALPSLQAQGSANVVMITSNRNRLPLAGGAFPDAARAGANALVRSLALDCAKDGIVINAIAPNFLYSEQYYPKARFVEAETGRAYLESNVPAGRLADPEEIGEVILFLATVKTRFLTGAILDFSGGWPLGAPFPKPA